MISKISISIFLNKEKQNFPSKFCFCFGKKWDRKMISMKYFELKLEFIDIQVQQTYHFLYWHDQKQKEIQKQHPNWLLIVKMKNQQCKSTINKSQYISTSIGLFYCDLLFVYFINPFEDFHCALETFFKKKRFFFGLKSLEHYLIWYANDKIFKFGFIFFWVSSEICIFYISSCYFR